MSWHTLMIYIFPEQRAAAYASKVPPPEAESHGTTNQGAAFPGDAELVNGKPKDPARTPISKLPDPMSQNAPVNRSRDSPGYADLGIKQITGRLVLLDGNNCKSNHLLAVLL